MMAHSRDSEVMRNVLLEIQIFILISMPRATCYNVDRLYGVPRIHSFTAKLRNVGIILLMLSTGTLLITGGNWEAIVGEGASFVTPCK